MKVLVKYIRDSYGIFDGSRGKPVGVVVATGPNQVGYSICNPKDKWNKKMAKHLAAGRAVFGDSEPIPLRKIIAYNPATGVMDLEELGSVVQRTTEQLRQRSLTYFKTEVRIEGGTSLVVEE